MRVPFSPKLRLALLWPAIAALGVVALLLGLRLPRQLAIHAAEELLATARLVEGSLAPVLAGPPEQWSARLAAWAARTPLRVTIIDREGRVLGESTRPGGDVGTLENHGDRPEVRDALRSGTGRSVRDSDTTGDTYAYAAWTFARPDGDVVVVRLAQPVSSLAGLRRQVLWTLATSALVALAVVLVLWWWLRRKLFAPLAELIAGANSLAQGELHRRLPVPDEDELSTLASAVNRLADRVEEQLGAVEGERDHLQEVLSSLPDGVLVTSGDGRAVSANPAFRRLFGLRDETVAGRAPLELVRLPSLARVVRDITAPPGQGQSQGQGHGAGTSSASPVVEIDSPERRALALSGSTLRGRPGGVVVARDVTRETRLDEMRRDFVANVSHELKTPLAAIRGYAETLRDGALDDRAAAPRFIDRILHQSRRLQALLEDLLTLSRLESVGIVVEEHPVDLLALVRRARETVAGLEHEKGVAIDIEAAGSDERRLGEPPAGEAHQVGSPFRLPGDAEALERMVSNLLENAVKYNRPGGWVRVRLAPAPRPGPGGILLEVADNGIGIPAPALPRIFERFYRVDRARSREEGGTGLGLAIVKHVAQAHGGRVEVESVIDQGTTFRVHLPDRSSPIER